MEYAVQYILCNATDQCFIFGWRYEDRNGCYTRNPFGRELEISCRAFTYRAGGRRSKQDRSLFSG